MSETRRRPTQGSASRAATLERRTLSRNCPSCHTPVPSGRRFCPACATQLPELAAAPLLDPGTLVDGRYRILELLGEGGMGAVFRVEHVRMGKIMALKILRRELAHDPDLIVRFEQEARIVSRLSHPNTVSVFDFGELPDHGLYMAMEFVPGKDLHTVLSLDGRVKEPRALGIAIQVLHSLGEAHDAGIIHRDVKPANVMLIATREGGDFVKVVDFGIAKLADPKRTGPRITGATGDAFVGTPEYVSPEQARGERLDARSDLYSLAALLFEITTGAPLFDGPTAMAIVSRHLTDPAPSAREVAPEAELSEGFDTILQKALAKDPEARFQSADEMRRALSQLADRSSRKVILPVRELAQAVTIDEAIARRTDWDQFERSLRRSGRIRAAVGVALAVVVLGGAAATVVALTRLPPKPASAPIQEEREPNNSAETANRIRPGQPVHGTIGARLNDNESDLDYFEFDVPGTKTARLELTAVPNVNVTLDLFVRAQNGGHEVWRALAKVDDQPVGSELPEVMDDLVLAPGTYAARVRDLRRPSETQVKRPRENSSDRYTLTVELAAPDPLGEREPNNTPEDARDHAPSGGYSSRQPMFGHAGGFAPREASGAVAATLWSDDYFNVALSPGARHACALLSGLTGARVRLQLADDAARAAPSVAGAGELAVRCARVDGSLTVRVDLESGAQYHERYLLTVIDDGESGTEGLQRALEWLTAAGRAADARALSSAALTDLAHAVSPVEPRHPR